MRRMSLVCGAAILSMAPMAHASLVNTINFNDAAGTNFTSNFVNTGVLLGGSGGVVTYSTNGVTAPTSDVNAAAVIYDGSNGGALTPVTTGAFDYTPITSSDFTVTIGFTMGSKGGIGLLIAPHGSTTPNDELAYYSNDYSSNSNLDTIRYFPYGYNYGQSGVQGSYAGNAYSTIDSANITSGTLSYEYTSSGTSAVITTTIIPTGSTTGYSVSQILNNVNSAGYITSPEVGVRIGVGSTLTSFSVVDNTSVPEPASASLVLLSSAAITLGRRRRV